MIEKVSSVLSLKCHVVLIFAVDKPGRLGQEDETIQ
jgi:hypothetical protein